MTLFIEDVRDLVFCVKMLRINCQIYSYIFTFFFYTLALEDGISLLFCFFGGFFCLFVWFFFWFFETGFLCVALAVLELTL